MKLSLMLASGKVQLVSLKIQRKKKKSRDMKLSFDWKQNKVALHGQLTLYVYIHQEL